MRQDVLEQTVLDGLQTRLMDPEIYRAFAEEFVAGWNQQQTQAAGTREALEAEHTRLNRQSERLVDAIANGTPPAAVNDRLHAIDQRLKVIESELAQAVTPAPRLHPALPELYRQRISDLRTALSSPNAQEARDMIRGLVEAVILVPEDGKLRIELRGALAAILSLASTGASRRSGEAPEAVALQIKMVAGAGFEPAAFRL